MTRLIVLFLFALLLLLLPRSQPRMLRAPCLPHDLTPLLPAGFEPSDAVWDPAFGGFWVVSDDSRVAKVRVGKAGDDAVEVFPVASGEGDTFDLEACAVIPGATLLLGSERPAAVLTFSPSDGVGKVWPLKLGGKKNKGLESLLFLPSPSGSEGEGWLLAGVQGDASLHVFPFPPGEEAELRAAAVLRNPPGPGEDLSAMAWREGEGRAYLVYDKGQEAVVVDLKELLVALSLDRDVEADGEPKEIDLSELPGYGTMALKRYALSERGVEALAFSAGLETGERVLMGIDAPEKAGGRKALLLYQGGQFDSCFAAR
ncbi:hypothetical protein DFJ74DRAFT_756474 [Hyaloraphidium curvatum]|nr:hypothetical protein DFJ74DRAFT_756474 [Hyaloraphidium curvatum]